MDLSNSDIQNAQKVQNASNLIGYHQAFEYYPLKPASFILVRQFSWSPHREPYEANPGVQIPSLLPTPFPVSFTTPFSFFPTPLFLYPITSITTPITTSISVPNKVFAEAPIVTLPLPTTLTAALVAPASSAAPATPAHQLAPISTFNNVRGSTKRRRRYRGTTTHGSTREKRSHRKIYTPQSHSTRASSPRGCHSSSGD